MCMLSLYIRRLCRSTNLTIYTTSKQTALDSLKVTLPVSSIILSGSLVMQCTRTLILYIVPLKYLLIGVHCDGPYDVKVSLRANLLHHYQNNAHCTVS